MTPSPGRLNAQASESGAIHTLRSVGAVVIRARGTRSGVTRPGLGKGWVALGPDDPEAAVRASKRVDPWPVFRQSQHHPSGPAPHAGGVEQPAAQRLGLGPSELAVESDHAHARQQVATGCFRLNSWRRVGAPRRRRAGTAGGRSASRERRWPRLSCVTTSPAGGIAPAGADHQPQAMVPEAIATSGFLTRDLLHARSVEVEALFAVEDSRRVGRELSLVLAHSGVTQRRRVVGRGPEKADGDYEEGTGGLDHRNGAFGPLRSIGEMSPVEARRVQEQEAPRPRS